MDRFTSFGWRVFFLDYFPVTGLQWVVSYKTFIDMIFGFWTFFIAKKHISWATNGFHIFLRTTYWAHMNSNRKKSAQNFATYWHLRRDIRCLHCPLYVYSLWFRYFEDNKKIRRFFFARVVHTSLPFNGHILNEVLPEMELLWRRRKNIA